MAGCRRAAAVAAALSFTFVQAALGQTLTVGDPLEDYLRVLQISGEAEVGSFMVRPWIREDVRDVLGEERGPWSERLEDRLGRLGTDEYFKLTAPELRTFANSRFPMGRNDGAVWQGRGLTTALDLGATLRWRAVTVEARPTVLLTQNAEQELAPVLVAGMPVYAYPWRKIDWPQRFGPDAFWSIDPGQSEVRVDLRGLSGGLSTKNLWWGPALESPILMSNNAPGFPHGFIATDGPLGVGVGHLEARWIWGRLQQSEWFDPAVATDERFITGITLAYSPSFVRGLSLGLARVLYVHVPEDGVPLGDYFAVFKALRKKAQVTPGNPTGDDLHDQLFSVFARWVLPASGFEVYLEWARNDHSWDVREFLLEPEHSQAYVAGLQKAFMLSDDRRLAVRAEIAHLEASATFELRGYPRGAYYEHSAATQGYTQRGQIIGAAIGPGGNAQSLGAEVYTRSGRFGSWLERQVHDNDAYYEWAAANGQTSCCHDVSFHWGTQALWFRGPFDIGAGMIVTREMNRWFYGLDLWNLNLSVSAKWHP